MVRCRHAYRSAGLRWWNDGQNRPGSGATTIRYYEGYFCEKCLDEQLVRLDSSHDSYTMRDPNAAPVSEKMARLLRSER